MKSNHEVYRSFQFVEPDSARRSTREFFEHMAKRRTIRSFSDKPVDIAIIENAIKAAGTAPNGANLQPWMFVAVSDPKIKAQIRQEAEAFEKDFYERRASKVWLEALKPLGTDANKSYLEVAPYLITIFSKTWTDEGSKEPTYYPIESTGIASGILITALHRAGLATLTHTPSPMRFLNKILGLGKNYRPFLLLVAGYPKEPIEVPKISRKPLEDISRFV